MISKIFTATLFGIDGVKVDVEVDITYGIPSFSIVGLPETSVKESKERVRSAIKNAGFEFPNDRITINLAPADLRKEGSSFDLPIAIGILASMGVVKSEVAKDFLIAGELSLDGRIKPVRGILPIAILAGREGVQDVIVPYENAREASIVKDVGVYGAAHLLDIVHFLRGEGELEKFAVSHDAALAGTRDETLNFADIKGQSQAKRALEIGASGSHNLLTLYTI